MRTKTISKYFFDDEIKGVTYVSIPQDSEFSSKVVLKRVIYLKTGIKRMHFNDDLGVGDHFEQLNQELIANERRELAVKILFGGDDFDDHTPKFEN